MASAVDHRIDEERKESLPLPTDAVTFENLYFALLGMAESFRTSNPPDIRRAIHCLEAIIVSNPPPRIEVRTRLQIGQLMWLHTKNTEHCLSHLEKALVQAKPLSNMEEVTLEITSLLASVYMKQQKFREAVDLLEEAIEVAINYQFWYCQLCFQLAKADMKLGVISQAVTTLAAGADYASRIGANHTKTLFSLSQAMCLLIQRNFDAADVILSEVGGMLESAQQDSNTLSLKVFYYVLQVAEYIWQGMIKAARQSLKQLHSCYKQLTQIDSSTVVTPSHPAECFHWMSTQQLFLLVYVVSVMHAMQQGYADKATSYAVKALNLIDKQRTYDNDDILSSYQIILLEQLVLTNILKGDCHSAAKELQKATVVYQNHQSHLQSHRAVLHMALGLYAMSLPQSLDNALAQFNTALQYTSEPEQVAFIKLNSIIVHLKQGQLPPEQLHSLLDAVEPGKMPNKCHSLKASSYCVQGIAALYEGRIPDAKRKLRETVVMANKADLNKLTSCAFLLLSTIFLKIANYKDAIDMAVSAHQIANRIPDCGLQLWSSELLANLYGLTEDAVKAAQLTELHSTVSSQIDKDNESALNTQEHSLLQWLDSEFPSSGLSMV